MRVLRFIMCAQRHDGSLREPSTALEWVQNMIIVKELAEGRGIILPAGVWYRLTVSQLSPTEIRAGQFTLPKNRDDVNNFDLLVLEAEIKALPPERLPLFRKHHVKAYLKKVMDRADESGKRSIMPHLREIRHMHKLFMDTDDYLTALK